MKNVMRDLDTKIVSITQEGTSQYIGELEAPQPKGGGDPTGTMNLQKYGSLPTPVMLDYQGNILGDFKGYKFVSCEEIKDSDNWKEKFYQPGIKDKDATDNDVEQLIDSIRDHGFLMDEYPPTGYYDTNGVFQFFNGRTRAMAMISEDKNFGTKKGISAEYVPVAIFEMRKNYTSRQIRNGSRKSNSRPIIPSQQNSMTFISAALNEIRLGTLKRVLSEVRDYIVNESGATEWTKDQANITKIINTVMQQSSKERGTEDCKYNRDSDSLKEFLNQMQQYGGPDHRNAVLINVNDSRPDRLVTKIFEDGMKKEIGKPIQIIFFHSQAWGNDGKQVVDDFVENFTKMYNNMFRNMAYNIGVTLNETPILYNILGCAPSIAGKHDEYYNEYKLVPLDEY